MLRRSCSLVTVAILSLGAALAVAQDVPEGGPKLVVPKKIMDFGTVPEGDLVNADFKLVNEGGEPLKIKAVRPTCGCTVAEFDEQIEPGAEGWVKAKLDTRGFNGPITKSLLVMTNDPETPNVSLIIKAKVQPYLEVLPRPLIRFSALQSEKSGQKVTVVSDLEQDFKVTKVESSVPFITAQARKLEEDELIPNRHEDQYEIAVSLVDDPPVGPVNAVINVFTNHPKVEKLPIKVFGVIRALIHVTPSQIQFGDIEARVKPGRNIIVVNNQVSKKVEVTRAQVDDPAFNAEVITVEEGQRYQVTVTIKEDAEPGTREALLTISTSDADTPELKVPVRATLK